MQTSKSEISDIFSSIQGEGIFVGAKQIFVRFRQCNLACAFCDEPWQKEAKLYSSLELMTEVKYLDLNKGPHHSISFTGGEPLMYKDFLKVFLKISRKAGFKSYLETNGTMPEALSEVIDLVDIISMDFKLPSSTGLRPYWDEHFEFLKIAVKKNVFVKAVVTSRTTREDVEKSVELVRRVKKDMPLVLQPVTPLEKGGRPVESSRLLEFLDIGSRNEIAAMRVIPQVHKMLGVK
ncbi:MAG: 7-carboxy-7-deazaguanine synthase QueE [Candidatus Omnitrophica bacterium]|nr:7-carboxy-7-deazaguanine synthase QueE [Candidatus Omnitrophota bacterium]